MCVYCLASYTVYGIHGYTSATSRGSYNGHEYHMQKHPRFRLQISPYPSSLDGPAGAAVLDAGAIRVTYSPPSSSLKHDDEDPTAVGGAPECLFFTVYY